MSRMSGGFDGRGRHDFDLRPALGRARDREPRADLLGTFTHDRQAPVTLPSRLPACRVETVSIVADAQVDAAAVIDELHPKLRRVCVPDGVDDGLLRDAQDLLLHVRGDRTGGAADG